MPEPETGRHTRVALGLGMSRPACFVVQAEMVRQLRQQDVCKASQVNVAMYRPGTKKTSAGKLEEEVGLKGGVGKWGGEVGGAGRAGQRREGTGGVGVGGSWGWGELGLGGSEAGDSEVGYLLFDFMLPRHPRLADCAHPLFKVGLQIGCWVTRCDHRMRRKRKSRREQSRPTGSSCTTIPFDARAVAGLVMLIYIFQGVFEGPGLLKLLSLTPPPHLYTPLYALEMHRGGD